MKIKSIESFILTDQLKESFYFSQWGYSQRRICIVKITTDTGVVGWGEGYGPADMIKSGIDLLTKYIIGENPLATERIWGMMYRRTMDFSRSGVLMAVISAIDIALWDLKGKILDLPVHLLLGGKKRDSIYPYATGMYFCEKDKKCSHLPVEALEYVKAGYHAMKMKVGLSVSQDIENVKKVRAAIGPNIHLMIDSNHAYNLREAVALARGVEDCNISWFEEPLSPEYYEQFAELRTKTNIPIAAGECEYLRFGFHRLFKSRAVDIAQPDICASGGLTEAKRIAILASVYGIEIVPHSWGTGIALSAAAHFISNLDDIPGRLNPPKAFIEYDRTENNIREQLTHSDMVFEDGQFRLSDAPGLGVTVSEDAVHKFSEELVEVS